MADILFKHTAIIGLGQMGASLGLALKAGGHIDYVTGYDLNTDHAEGALNKGAVDTIASCPESCVKGADLIILCTPVGCYGPIMQTIEPYLKEDAVLSDIGSIKAQAIRDIAPHVPGHVHFVPAHPIAGSEKTGPEHAHTEFFHKHLFLITPPAGTAPDSEIGKIETLWISTGASVDILDPALHDTIYAYMSHLPQYMAYAAAAVLDAYGIRAGDGEDEILFRRFIRISRSDPEMWRDVFLENRENMLTGLDIITEILTHMLQELQQGEAENTAPPDIPLCAKQLWPQILGSALITAVQLAEQQLERKLAIYAAGGFTDFLAPATDAPEPDLDAMSAQASTLAAMLERFLEIKAMIRAPLEAKDNAVLFEILHACQAHGMALIEPRYEA